MTEILISMYEVQAEMEEHERMYEPTYNPEDGSM